MGAEQFLPPNPEDLGALRRAAVACRGCDLYQRATQTVFGAGPEPATVVLVGEQPGDQEDRQGVPFVGPAGALLDRALEAAGLERERIYLTNAVKHFKWEPRGKRRLHKTPSARERAACLPWLMAELGALDPDVVVCLGATAAQALFGSSFRIGRHRGEVLETSDGRPALATVHPAAVLRGPDETARQAAFDGLVADLEMARVLVTGSE
jgi:DNA polymerase